MKFSQNRNLFLFLKHRTINSVGFSSPKFVIAMISFVFAVFYAFAGKSDKAWLIDEKGQPVGEIRVGDYFREESPQGWQSDRIVPPHSDFAHQTSALLDFISVNRDKKPFAQALRAGVTAGLGVTFEDVVVTLKFVQKIMEEDRLNGRISRLSDPVFVSRHFRFIRWLPHFQSGQMPQSKNWDTIRLTKYAVFTIPGRLTQTEEFNCPLYRIPENPEFLKYTKQEVLSGAYDRGGAEPLVWLTRDGLEDALLQGSVCVDLPNGEKRFYNADQGNGVPFDPLLKDQRLQKRYWYFDQTAQPQGYGPDIHSQIKIYPGAAVAGDVYNLGLGKLLAAGSRNPRTGRREWFYRLLADTGGAFTPNLSQLDLYMGICNGKKEFKEKKASFPERAALYILILRSDT